MQMQANAQIEFGSEGKKWAQWEPSYEFEGDYLRWILGVHNTAFDKDKGGFQFRSRIDWREKVKGEGFMTITPSYPVFVAKLSIPRQSQVKTPGDSNFWIEFFWHMVLLYAALQPQETDWIKQFSIRQMEAVIPEYFHL